GYDEVFITLACSDPAFFKYNNTLEYIQATSLKLLAAIEIAVHDVTEKFETYFNSYPEYVTQMKKIIDELASTISTHLSTDQDICFSKIQADIQAMKKMTGIAKTMTEKGDLFRFFKPT